MNVYIITASDGKYIDAFRTVAQSIGHLATMFQDETLIITRHPTMTLVEVMPERRAYNIFRKEI